jgi:hypothetical protein
LLIKIAKSHGVLLTINGIHEVNQRTGYDHYTDGASEFEKMSGGKFVLEFDTRQTDQFKVAFTERPDNSRLFTAVRAIFSTAVQLGTKPSDRKLIIPFAESALTLQPLANLRTLQQQVRGAVLFVMLKNAIEQNHILDAETLLKLGTNPNTLVYLAIRQGRTEILELLLKYGADEEGKDKYAAPLHKVISEHLPSPTKLQMVNILFKYGAKLEYQRSNDGETPLATAIHYGELEIAKLIFARQGIQIDDGVRNIDQALRYAVGELYHFKYNEASFILSVDWLISVGADVRSTRLLQESLSYNLFKLAEKLLKTHPADVNQIVNVTKGVKGNLLFYFCKIVVDVALYFYHGAERGTGVRQLGPLRKLGCHSDVIDIITNSHHFPENIQEHLKAIQFLMQHGANAEQVVDGDSAKSYVVKLLDEKLLNVNAKFLPKAKERCKQILAMLPTALQPAQPTIARTDEKGTAPVVVTSAAADMKTANVNAAATAPAVAAQPIPTAARTLPVLVLTNSFQGRNLLKDFVTLDRYHQQNGRLKLSAKFPQKPKQPKPVARTTYGLFDHYPHSTLDNPLPRFVKGRSPYTDNSEVRKLQQLIDTYRARYHR